MADLIDRQAVLDELEEQGRKCPLSFGWGLDRAINVVFHAPAVDAVEVGSCEGCYWKAIGRYHKCSCCRRNRDMKDCYCGISETNRREENG